MIARGDRANAERLVRSAWRSDSMSEDTESAALDLFGALITPGDHKARMDFLLYGSEHEAGAARRQTARREPCGAGEGAHRGQQEGRNAKALLKRCRANCTATPATSSARFSCCAAKRSSPRPPS